MTYKNDDELKREILDAMVTCDGFVSRVAAQCHVDKTTIFRWLAASEINPESHKLEWGENGVKPFHVHAKLARRMGRLVARSDYFDDETPQPEKPAPYVDDAEEVTDDAARIARARSDVAKGPQMHPPRRSHERMLEDAGVKIPSSSEIDMKAIMQGARDAQAHRDQLEAAVEAAKPVDEGDLTTLPATEAMIQDGMTTPSSPGWNGKGVHMVENVRHGNGSLRNSLERAHFDSRAVETAKPVDDGNLTSPAPAPVSTGDGRADELARLLAKIERRGTPPTALEADVIARLEQAPTRPRPSGAPVHIGRPSDEPDFRGSIPGCTPTEPRKPWTPTGAGPVPPRRAPDVDQRPDPETGTRMQ